MKDCHSDLIAFHNEKVALTSAERKEMRGRRNENRKRLEQGLERDEEPASRFQKSQGSYAMWTMVQHKDKDYDIDDGVYFDKDALVGPKGGDKTPAATKEMVRKAVHDDNFSTPPTVRTNCVRIIYNAGYHVDLPVYRVTQEEDFLGNVTESYELASTDWKPSDPSEVTAWFTSANQSQSANTKNGGQLRRVARFLKAFARSRDSWTDRTATGFMISALVVERFEPDESREDVSLHNTMRAIRDRLSWNLVIDHPVISGETLTRENDGRPGFLKDKLDEALKTLEVLSEIDCSREDALKAWGKVFNTGFFDGRSGGDDGNGGGGGKGTSAAVLIKKGEESQGRDAVDKRGGGTYA